MPPEREVNVSLGDLAQQLDAQRFVGRHTERALVAEALAGSRSSRLVYVHGRGGVGKSALCRAVARDAELGGYRVHRLDGRTLTPDPDELRAAFVAAADHSALLIIDEIDQLAAMRVAVRDLLVQVMPASSVVVLVGRCAPDRTWFDAGLDQVVVELRLRPLGHADALELLCRLGVHDAAVCGRLVRWSGGSPLALIVAAQSAEERRLGMPVPPPALGVDGDVEALLADRLGGGELSGVDPDVLDVAGVASVVDARVLAAALPGGPVRGGLAQLRDLSTAERLGARVSLHRLLRSAVRARLASTDPDRYRTLVMRTAEHLRHRALTEDHRLLLELADLVEDPELPLSFDPGTSYFPDRVRAGDLDAVARVHDPTAGWFGRLRRWCEDAPESVLIVRHADGTPASLVVLSTPASLPGWAAGFIEVAPAVDHAARAGHLDESFFAHTSVVIDPPVDSDELAEMMQVGNSAGFARGLVRSQRYGYLTAVGRREWGAADLLGYRELPELRRSDDGRELFTLRSDFGPDGLIGMVFAIIQEEQLGVASVAGSRGVELIDALRHFHDDDALRRCRIDGDPDEVRAVVRAAVDAAFGDGPTDAVLRQALVRAYLDVDGGHAPARAELHMSRSSFYRHLQRARQRLADSAR